MEQIDKVINGDVETLTTNYIPDDVNEYMKTLGYESFIETNVPISFLSWIILSAFTSPMYGSFIKYSLLAMLILINSDVFCVIFFLSDLVLFSNITWL